MMSTPETVKDLKDPKSSIDSVIEEYQSTGFPDKRSHRYFSYLSSLYLILLSLPLLAFPRPLNQLETYLSRLVGLSFLTLASLIVLQTGAIPVSSSMVHGSDTTSNTARIANPRSSSPLSSSHFSGFRPGTWIESLLNRVKGALTGGINTTICTC
ncbi:hypothetical protein KEM48_009413 [Puccinia striiformis f. sp. tritici PST-130]|nr:hypothetical protein KEM48_009413 [Puccinia striiformis f. sp. tritici PST-130]